MKRVEVVGKEDVFLGRLGDTEVREFALDISEWKECMDGAYSISCLYVPPKTADNLAYPIAIDHYRVEGDRLVWIPTATECAVIGWAKFEAVLYNENQQVSTLIWRVQIGKSLVGNEEPPEGWENYIIAVERLVDEIESMTVSASVDANVGTPSVTVETSGGQGEPFSIDFEFKNLKGEQGETGGQGVGIASISIAEKSTSGLDVTYTMTATKTDGTTTASDFTVTNGNGIASAVLNADYTLTLNFDDGTHYTTPSIRGEQGEQGEQGIQGVGISNISVSKTSTVGLVDTYTMTITYTNGNSETETFEVTNGKDAELSDNLPLMDGTADAGTDTEASRSDHVHPSDTTKEDKGKMTQTVSGYLGGTVVWNQLQNNTNNRSYGGITFSFSNGALTVSGEATQQTFWGVQTGYVNIPMDISHVYLFDAGNPNYGGDQTTYSFYLSGYYKNFYKAKEIFKVSGQNRDVAFNMMVQSGYEFTNAMVFHPQLFDLTQMFGSTIANYIYSLEQNTPGAGVAWFKQYFPLDYYSYDAGSLKSVDAVNYALFGYPRFTLDTALRGIPKLDADNNLTYDADSEENGTVTRRYGVVDLGTLTWIAHSDANTFIADISDIAPYPMVLNILCSKYVTVLRTELSTNDKAIAKGNNSNPAGRRIFIHDSAYSDKDTFATAMSGVYLVYELATPTTETVTSTPVSLTIPPYPPNGDYNLVYENGSLKWVDMQSYINQRIAEVQALILEG